MNQKLNIFHISQYPYHTGGIDTWLHSFLIHNHHRYDITVFCPESLSLKVEAKFDLSVYPSVDIRYMKVINNRYCRLLFSHFYNLYQIYKLRNVINQSSIHLVLSTIPQLPILLLKKIGIIHGKLICSVRGVLSINNEGFNSKWLLAKGLFILEKETLLLPDKLLSNGWDTQSMLKKHFSLKSQVIPNAINYSFLSSYKIRSNSNDKDYKKVLELKKSKKIILHLGTLRTVKEISTIIDSIQALASLRSNDYILLFIGKGNIKKYRQECNEKNVTAIFLGEKANMDYYESTLLADIVINISGGSGLSNSLIECMAFGKIVVAWDKLTFNQVISHGQNGYLAMDQNTLDLAQKINDGLNNSSNIREHDIKASVKKFDWSIINQSWIDVIND